jgi:hypothetical protein
MDADTPLPEVAVFLSAETAELLLWETPYVQHRVIELVRGYIIALEQQDLVMDPILLQDRIDRVVRLELNALKKGREMT